MSSDEHVPEQSFHELYHAQFRFVTDLCASLCGSWTEGEDVAQEAFVALHRHWARVSRYDRPELWVRRVAINRASSSRRGRRRAAAAVPKLAAGADGTDRRHPERAGFDALLDEVRRLPKAQAQAVALVYVMDLDIAEAAEVLDCSASTLRTHLQRARTRLRDTPAFRSSLP